MDSAISKYISLFECRIPCFRHGIGAANGAVVGACILDSQLVLVPNVKAGLTPIPLLR
jgi:hypothetical protein